MSFAAEPKCVRPWHVEPWLGTFPVSPLWGALPSPPGTAAYSHWAPSVAARIQAAQPYSKCFLDSNAFKVYFCRKSFLN